MSLRGRKPSKNKLALRGAIWCVVIAVLCFFGFTKANPFADKYEIKAAFKNVNQLKASAPVRVAGVDVGKVTRIDRLGDNQTGSVVTMEIEDSGLPIKKDATFKVRPRIFLEGNDFVEVSPGSPSAPELARGDTVPATQTASPVGLFSVLQTLQSDTREDLQITLQEYGKAINSKGGDGYRRSIKYQAPAFRDSAIVNDATLGILEHDLSNYLAGAARFAEGLSRNPRQLQNLVTDFAKTADAFAVEQANLSRAIARLPGTLQTGRSALGELNRAFPPLRRLVADLRPAVRSSGPSLDATLPFVRQMRRLVSKPELQGLVADLRKLVPNLVELNRGGIALQEQQRLLSSCQNNVVNPWQNDTVPDPNFKSSGPVYQEGVKWLPGIAGESRSFDANGQYVRSLAKTANYAYPADGGRFFLTDKPLLGVNPPKAKQPPLRADVPCETQERPDLNTRIQAAPSGFKVDQNAPGALERRAQARAVAIEWMQDQMKATGWDEQLKLSDEPLKAGEIGAVKGTLEGGG